MKLYYLEQSDVEGKTLAELRELMADLKEGLDYASIYTEGAYQNSITELEQYMDDFTADYEKEYEDNYIRKYDI